MKKGLLFGIFIIMSVTLFAQKSTTANGAGDAMQRETGTHVTANEARIVGLRFLNANTRQMRGTSDLQMVTAYRTAQGDTAFYVFNTNHGFVIVAADRCSTPILGYSDEGPFNVNNVPIQMQGYLQGFVEQIAYGIGHPTEVDTTSVHQWQEVKNTGRLTTSRTNMAMGDNTANEAMANNLMTKSVMTTKDSVGKMARKEFSLSDLMNGTASDNHIVMPTLPQNDRETKSGGNGVAPLITAMWDQGCYYNAACPTDAGGDCEHVPTGCVATAMGMIMHYWDYPMQGSGTHSYTPDGYPTQTVDFGTTTYDWTNMPDQLTATSTQAEIDAVSTLLWHCGVAVDMVYGATSSSALNGAIPQALTNFFGYCNGSYFLSKEVDSEWLAQVKASLDQNRPLIYFGTDVMGLGSHAFVCDGYDASDNLHFNWGWGGNGNGYFAVDALNVDVFQFNNEVHALFGIVPQSEFQLHYNIIEGGVEVTYEQPEVGIPAYSNYPDTIVIPSQVNIDGTTYPVIAIGDKAFQCCWDLKSVNLPNTIKSIGEYAFYSDYQIVHIDIPDSVVTIKAYSLLGTDISSIELPNALTTIGRQALDWTPIVSLTIPRSVITIGDGLCGGCDTVNWNADSCEVELLPGYGCLNLFWGRKINFGVHVKHIPGWAFCTCACDTVIIPDSVISIGGCAFSNSSIKYISFGNSIISIGGSAFEGCVNLVTVYIPEQMHNIGIAAFANCDDLTTVYFNAINCIEANQAFNWDANLTQVLIGDSVTIIPMQMFSNCHGLESITIPASVTKIGHMAFSDCHNLHTFYMLPTEAPTIKYWESNGYVEWGASGEYTFMNNAPNRIFNIPCEYFDSYYYADGWETYRSSMIGNPGIDIQLNIEVADSLRGTNVIIRHASSCDSTVIYYAQANHGYLFDHWSNGRTSNPDTLLLTNDTTIVAYFRLDQFDVTGISAKKVYFSNFEASSGDTTWFFKNDDYPNKWYINNLDNNNRALFISSDNGLTNSCTNTRSYVFAYTPISFTAGDYVYCYRWRDDGHDYNELMESGLIPYSLESDIVDSLWWGYDWMKGEYGALFLRANHSENNDWQTQQGNVQLWYDTIYNLVFYWRLENPEADYTNGYPAAVDDIVIGNLNAECGYVIGADNVTYLDTATVTAVPNPGYRFVFWYDCDTNITKQVVVTGDMSCVAYFEAEQYSVIVSAADASMGSVSGGGTYNYLSECTITATPAEGLNFIRWSDGNKENPRTFTVTQDTVLTAYFGVCSDTNVVETVTACDSYTWFDSTYTESGDYTQTFTATNGCDSVVTLHLTIYPTLTVSISGNQLICESDPVTLTADVEVYGSLPENLHYIWYENGQILDNMSFGLGDNNTYMEYLPARSDPYQFSVEVSYGAGCFAQSGEYLVYVHSLPVVQVTASETIICENGEVTLMANLNDYNINNVIFQWYTVGQEIDIYTNDTVTVHYNIPGATQDIFSAILDATTTFGVDVMQFNTPCMANDEITINVENVPETPVVTVNNATVYEGGQVTLNVINQIAGATYTWYRNGILIEGATQATLVDVPVIVGEYVYTVMASLYNSGCISGFSEPVAVTVNAIPVAVVTVEGNTVLCDGGSVTLHADVAPYNDPTYLYQWFEDGVLIPGASSDYYTAVKSARDYAYNFTVVVSAMNGGFSITANAPAITVVPQPVVTIARADGYAETVCEGGSTVILATVIGGYGEAAYQWYENGFLLPDETSAVLDIDNLTVGSNDVYAVSVAQEGSGCSGFTSAAISSLVTVIATNYTEVFETACDSYTWNDSVYTQTGDYTQVFTTVSGCDSVVTLHLIVNQSTTGTDVQTACDSYTWIDGVTYTESNSTATYTLTNAVGCDSVVTLNLTLNHAETAEFAETVCESFEWNGETFTISGDYTRTFTNVVGCDSVVTLHLTIYPTEESEFSISTSDSCYIWNGISYCTSGDYTQTLQTVHGCDSVVTLHLTVSVGIEDHNLDASMTVYPNPTTGVVNVECTMNNVQKGTVEFHVYDAFGRLLRITDGVETFHETSLQTDTHGLSVQTQIDLSHYAAGIYFVKAVADGNVVAVRKVINN